VNSLPNSVLTKLDFVRRYQAGEFGNRAPTWDTVKEFKRSGYVGLVHIRNRVAGGPTWYDVQSKDVEQRVAELEREGHSQLYLSGMAPTHLTKIQGEVQRSITHLDLFYSTVPKPMRAALVEGGRSASGVMARLLLNSYADQASYEWIDCLLNRYPEHVVEFSVYSVYWGTIPRRNTVIWEVRKY
jgi:hypothetical protein